MTAERWGQLMTGASRTGYAPDNTGIEGEPGVRWSFNSNRPFSPPVVSGSRVFAGGEDEHLYALERETGDLCWSLHLGEKIQSAPAITGDRVVVKGSSGTLAGVDAEVGTVRWQRSVGSGRDVPAVADGTVYVCGQGEPVYALDVADGSTVWSSDAFTPAATPAVSDELAVLARGSKTVALDAETGQTAWERDVGGVDQGTPAALADGRAYTLCDDDTCKALNLASGAVLWSVDLSHMEYYATVALPHAVDGSHVYVGHYPRSVTALDVMSGDTAWETEVADRPTMASIQVAEGTLYVVSPETGALIAFDRSGEVRWTFDVPSGANTPAAVVDGTVFVGCGWGEIVAIEGE